MISSASVLRHLSCMAFAGAIGSSARLLSGGAIQEAPTWRQTTDDEGKAGRPAHASVTHRGCSHLPLCSSTLLPSFGPTPQTSVPAWRMAPSMAAMFSTQPSAAGTKKEEQQQQHAAPRQREAPEEGEAKPPPLSLDVHYEGPLSKTHKLLKMISISNTAIAFAAAPVIVNFAEISYVSRVGLAASLVFFGVITTGALHWITHPYVHELRFSAATQQVEVRTTTLLGRQRWHSFPLSDVQPLPWSRPVATFVAQGRFYYIDVYSFPDEDLLQRLTPDEASVPKGYKDDEDD